MSRWNKERRLLDHEHSTFWHHRLQEVEEPNLMRNIFPYTEVARIDFDYKFVMPSPPEEMLLTDTTFRDGQQARPPYTVRQIVDIFDLLHRLSGPKGIVRQTEFFLYSAKDKEAVEQCRERGYDISGNHRLDPGPRLGPGPGERDGSERNRHPHLGVRLPHLPEAELGPEKGHGGLPGHRQGRPGHWALFPGATSRTSPGPTSTGFASPSPSS